MMWNFKADIDLDENGKGYGGYNDLWQVVGFIYPLVGLLCFFIPICIVSTPEAKLTGPNGERLEVQFDEEEDEAHRVEQAKIIAKLKEEQATKA